MDASYVGQAEKDVGDQTITLSADGSKLSLDNNECKVFQEALGKALPFFLLWIVLVDCTGAR